MKQMQKYRRNFMGWYRVVQLLDMPYEQLVLWYCFACRARSLTVAERMATKFHPISSARSPVR
jgi:hypothetical protein